MTHSIRLRQDIQKKAALAAEQTAADAMAENDAATAATTARSLLGSPRKTPRRRQGSKLVVPDGYDGTEEDYAAMMLQRAARRYLRRRKSERKLAVSKEVASAKQAIEQLHAMQNNLSYMRDLVFGDKKFSSSTPTTTITTTIVRESS